MIRLAFEKNLDKSGKMFKKKYLENNYPDILSDIMNYSRDNDLMEISFKEQVYNWYKNTLPKKCYCGNNTKFKNSTIGYYDYCSKECMNNSNYVKEKRKRTNIKKFGTKTPSENIEIKNKIIETNNEKYGHNSPLQNKFILEKSKETLNTNYNVDNPLKSDIIKNRLRKTNIMRYGVDNPLKDKKIREKIKDKIFEKYGVYHATQNEEIKKKLHKHQLETISRKIKEYYKEYKILNIDNLNKNYKMECDKGHVFNINYTLLNSRRKTDTIVCTLCNPIDKSVSGLEIELNEFIKSVYDGDIIFNDGHLAKELDIYLPEIKLAYEFNGLWWHNEINKPTNYHLEKTKICEENGIQLIHIWEDEWVYKKDIVKSMIMNRVGKTVNKVYARKTIVKEIFDNTVCRNFLNKNHIQGFVGSSIKLGLFYEDGLVSMMTFGKKRLLTNNTGNKNEYELLRFCNKLNTNVIGGASKLLKNFIRNYNPSEIITYANNSYSNGNLYERIGFEYIGESKPNYHYIIDKIRRHRFSFRKSELIKKGKSKNKSEHDIMLENKIYRIYDSGNKKYLLKNEKD